ncbi:MAG: RDD family protein [Flavobacterium sp.]|nr:RDD family protein [Flavobacterium sp.]
MKRVGIGTRVINFLVDTILIAIIAYFIAKGYRFYVYYYGYKGHNFAIFFWGTLLVYYTFFEAIFTRTPGKFLSYSKVVSSNGKRPNILQILVRSLVRITIIDMFFQPLLDKTLHDYLSKTDVVEV